MISGRTPAWLTAALIGWLAACAVVAPDPAIAQGATRDPGPFTTTVRPQLRRSTAPEPVEEPMRMPGNPVQAGDPDAPVDPALDPDDPSSRRPTYGRPVPIDGDPNWPPQPVTPVDGVIEMTDPEQPVDGTDPTTVDTRPAEDAAPFELPSADLNPEVFQVELEPILDRRPAQLARFEPFAAAGIRKGSFVIFPEAEIGVVALDNLYRSTTNTRRDIALDVRPTVRVASVWARHALEFRATGLSTFHNSFPAEDDRGYGFEQRGRLDISRRTNIEAFIGYELGQEARGSINSASRTGDRADIQTRRGGVTLNHRFNRLSVQIRGTVTDLDYSSSTTDTGGLAPNDERDTSTKEIALRGSWAFKPELAAFSEVAVNSRAYGGVPSDGISRESHGERVRVGLSFGNTGRRLRGEVSVGHGHQKFDDSRLPEIRGIIVDANIAWRISGLTTLLVTARTDIGESTLAGSGGSLSRTAGLELRHEFQRRLIGTAGLRTTNQDYEGIDLTEREIAALLGLEYHLNREVTLFSRYQHIAFDSTDSGRNYNADEIRVGVRVRR